MLLLSVRNPVIAESINNTQFNISNVPKGHNMNNHRWSRWYTDLNTSSLKGVNVWVIYRIITKLISIWSLISTIITLLNHSLKNIKECLLSIELKSMNDTFIVTSSPLSGMIVCDVNCHRLHRWLITFSPYRTSE